MTSNDKDPTIHHDFVIPPSPYQRQYHQDQHLDQHQDQQNYYQDNTSNNDGIRKRTGGGAGGGGIVNAQGDDDNSDDDASGRSTINDRDEHENEYNSRHFTPTTTTNNDDVATRALICEQGREEEAEESGGDDDGDEDEENEVSLDEVLYSASSYHAIAKPVTLTMILAALAVQFINTDQSQQMGQAELQAYTVYKNIDNTEQGTGTAIEHSVLNALVIVTVIGIMTFGIVLLYKYRCMKCLIGYMMFSSSMLLGFLGGTLFNTAIERFRIPIDLFTFFFLMYNFAIVGTTAIFYQRGIPTYITQCYLVATSVILAWQLSHFDAWTTWALLVMLALYDLCAVLTPCGPLKALVNLMQEDDSPEMPGLLYEAELPEGTRRPGGPRNASAGRRNSNRTERSSGSVGNETERSSVQQPYMPTEVVGGVTAVSTVSAAPTPSTSEVESRSSTIRPHPHDGNNFETGYNNPAASQQPTSASLPSSHVPSSGQQRRHNGADQPPPTTAMLPRAIARLYRLPLVSPPPHSERIVRAPSPSDVNAVNVSTSPLLQNADGRCCNNGHDRPVATNAGNGLSVSNDASVDIAARRLTPAELREEVEVIFPRNGGRIERRNNDRSSRNGQIRYFVLGRDGEVRRVLLMDRQGRVFQETGASGERDDSEYDSDDEGGEEKPTSIRLGLGDFIFYSVLVSKAAAYNFTTFIACMLSILAGLGGTLVLLGVYHKALPALPISIFLGVVFYMLTRLIVEPWIKDLLLVPYYV